MIDLTINITTTRKTVFSSSINGKQLKEYLGVPPDAKVYVQIPGGGDWSNEDIDIDYDFPLLVEYMTIHEEET